MSTAYAEHLVPAVFQPYADDLADRIARNPPRTVLELAAGTGVLTEAVLARLPSLQITATDLNEAMVDVGSAKVPGATWQQADAMDLPFDDSSFDLVACQFGVMFLPDRPASYAGIARVLKPGGRFLFNCWGPLATHTVETAVIGALAKAFPEDPPTFLARVPHGYHDAELVAADLAKGGFDAVVVEEVELECRSPSAGELARGYCRGTPLRPEIEARGDLDAATKAVQEALIQQFGSGPVVGRMSALVVSAEAR
jgi:SAM-dependent methyltransferase